MKLEGSEGGSPEDHASGEVVRQWRGGQWRAELARQWATRLGDTSYIPMSRSDIEQRLLELVDRIAGALEAPSEIDETGHAVGSSLVRMHATGEESLTRTLELLRDGL